MWIEGTSSPFRVGLVREQDIAGARVRVVFPDRQQLQSYWLPVVVAKTQNDKAYFIPDVGEQVVCLMDERDEAGAVLGAIYSQTDATPVQSADKFHVGFKDGASVEYDRAAHKLAVELPDGGEITIAASAATIAIDGNGNVSVGAGTSAATTLTAGGAVVSIDAAGNVNLSASAAGRINLGSGGAGVARLGDQVKCPAGNGTIVTASATVLARS